jgi:hypothetical protein
MVSEPAAMRLPPSALAAGAGRPALRLVTCVVALVALLTTGCRRRAPAIEFANRHYSAALRTAANTRSPARVARAKALITRDHAAGAIAPEEHAWYAEIIALAEAGRWADAERRAIDFRRDQGR